MTTHNTDQTPLAEKLQGKNVGVALSSGFFGFFHHAGFLKALDEIGVHPKMITGTSAGALVGGMYASGLTPDEIEQVFLGIKRPDFWDLHYPFTKHGFSFLAGYRLRGLLSKHLKNHDFASCRLPLALGTYNIKTGRIHYLETGSLIDSIYASCAVNYLFAPIEINGHVYWDGGFAERTPLVPFLDRDDIDTVVVSYLTKTIKQSPEKLSRIAHFLPSPKSFFAHTPLEEKTERDRSSIQLLRNAGKEVIVLGPERIQLGPFSMNRGHQAAVDGYQATMNTLTSAQARLGCRELS